MSQGGDKTIHDIRDDKDFLQSLSTLSASKNDSDNGRKYVISSESDVGRFEAVDFDAVKNEWYKNRGKFDTLPKSADALIVDGDEFFLVEFKTKTIERADILRKAYDSAMALVEFGGLSWKRCKEHLTFILVGSEADTRLADLRKISLDDYMSPSYNGADSDPRTVTGQIVKEFLLFTPEEFEAFAVERNWTRPKEASQTTEPGASATQ